jgi:hypothetical protein
MEMFDILAEGAPQGALTEENHGAVANLVEISDGRSPAIFTVAYQATRSSG